VSATTARRIALPRLFESPAATSGLAIILFWIIIAIVAPGVAPYSPTRTYTPMLSPFSHGRFSTYFWLGTDNLGCDILSRLIFGTLIAAEPPLAERVRRMLQARKVDHALERAFYTDPAIYQLDLQAIFQHEWIFAAATCELPESGCFVTLTIGDSPILILRDRTGEIRAFFNTCRHRGFKFCDTARGRMAFACIDGTIARAHQKASGVRPSKAHRPLQTANRKTANRRASRIGLNFAHQRQMKLAP
jgi:hypothetical protein